MPIAPQKAIILICVVLLLGLAPAAPSVSAQEPAGTLQVNRIDTSAFPEVRVYVSVSDAAGARPVNLKAGDFALREDSEPIADSVLSEEATGVQVAIVCDSSGNTRRLKGRTGALLIDEIKNAITTLVVDSPYLDRAERKDWVTIIAPKGDSLETLVPWTTDYNLAYNTIYQYQVPDNKDTPLFKMLFEALRNMGPTNTTVPPGLQKSIIVFSDGIDVVSDLELQDAANRAAALGVPIHTVRLGTQGNAKNMSRIAGLTNGTFVEYGASAPGAQSLDALFKGVTSQHTQYVLTYRSKVRESGTHQVAVTYTPRGTGSPVTATNDFSSVIKPPAVTIVAPAANTTYERVAPVWDTPNSEVEPKGDTIQIAYSFPDGYARAIRAVEFEVDGVVFKVDQPPLDRFAWDLTGLDSGPHSLRARVTDELGLVGESEALPVIINIVRPPAPTPTPAPMAAPVIIKTVGPAAYAALALAALSLLGVLYLLIFRREVVREATSVVKRGIATATAPFLKERTAKRPQGQAHAVLIVLSSDDPNRQPIPLVRENTKLGRDAALADVIFEDPHVSRLHARIREEEPGRFNIYDEGSTSGTYVNDELVPMTGKWLDHGDEIDLGPIHLRFELAGVTSGPVSAPPTEPLHRYQPETPTEEYNPVGPNNATSRNREEYGAPDTEPMTPDSWAAKRQPQAPNSQRPPSADRREQKAGSGQSPQTATPESDPEHTQPYQDLQR